MYYILRNKTWTRATDQGKRNWCKDKNRHAPLYLFLNYSPDLIGVDLSHLPRAAVVYPLSDPYWLSGEEVTSRDVNRNIVAPAAG